MIRVLGFVSQDGGSVTRIEAHLDHADRISFTVDDGRGVVVGGFLLASAARELGDWLTSQSRVMEERKL